jgi:transposase InsO family protein
MPWNEVSAVDLRSEFVRLAGAPGANVSALCARYGVSRQTGYKWLRRFAAGGDAALAERSRRPHACPHRTADDVERRVVELRLAHPTWGGRKIAARLAALGQTGGGGGVGGVVPAPSTVTAILRRHGLIDPAESAKRGAFARFERAAPNELWQLDFKGHFPLAAGGGGGGGGGGGRCHPLTCTDDHSRFNLVLAACADERTDTVRGHLTAAFRRYGLPWELLSDNGPPFGGDSAHGLTPLGVWLIRLGVGVAHGRPYHPQTQGKAERFHRTLAADAIAGRAFRDLADAQRRFDAFRDEYNLARPHEALGMATPAARYRPSPRPFPEALPPVEYAPGDAVRKVQSNGEIYFRGRPWPVATCLRGLPVAVRPTAAAAADGVMAVFFCGHEVARIDLREDN